MSDLIVIAYDDEFKAEEVRLTLAKLQVEHLIELEDAAVVVKDEHGKIKLKQANSIQARMDQNIDSFIPQKRFFHEISYQDNHIMVSNTISSLSLNLIFS